MAVIVPTVEELKDVWRDALALLPLAQQMANREPLDRICRGLTSLNWCSVSDAVSHLSVSPQTVLFRVAYLFTLDKHKDGQLAQFRHAAGEIVARITTGLSRVKAVCYVLEGPSVQGAVVGKEITFMADGIIDLGAEDTD